MNDKRNHRSDIIYSEQHLELNDIFNSNIEFINKLSISAIYSKFKSLYIFNMSINAEFRILFHFQPYSTITIVENIDVSTPYRFQFVNILQFYLRRFLFDLKWQIKKKYMNKCENET